MSKSLKKLIDINRLREFKNKLVGADSAYVQTGEVDQTVGGTKTFPKPIVGSVTGSSGSCTGNAASATKLQTARTINGTSFNGTANITTANWGTARSISITDGTNTSTAVSVNGSANVSLKLPATIKATFVGNITGNVTGNCSGSSGSCTGNAASATKLAAKRTIALSGAATGTATGFDGTANIAIPVTSLDASKLTGTASVSTTGNAATATRANSVAASAIRDHILSMVYPVGSVYISVNDVSPEKFLGGTWEKISQGRVLQGASDTQTAGTEVSAGLPNISVSSNGEHTHTRGSMNITGQVGMHGAGSCTVIGGETGAFYVSGTESAYNAAKNCVSGASSRDDINFSADRAWTGSTSSAGAHSHDVYITDITGKSTTVQPPALLVNIWKRTA